MNDDQQACLNCQSPLRPEDHFCSECGQKVIHKNLTMKAFYHQFMADYFTFDSKFFKSVFPLLIRPGFLTSEFFEGRRVRYITPLRLYIFISLIFFLILGLLGSTESSEDIDKLINAYFPRMFFLLLPVFAGILMVLNVKRQPNFVIHFLFALHFHSFLFLLGAIYLLITEVFEKFDLIIVNQILAAIAMVGTLVYLFVALKKVYRDSVGVTIVKYLSLLLLYGLMLTLASLTTLLFLSTAE